MLFGSVGAVTIGLISTSFIISVRGDDGIFHDRCVPPPKASGHFFETSANVISNDVTSPHCNGVSKFMKIELNEEFKNMREDFSNGWNYYETVPPDHEWNVTNLSYAVDDYAGYSEDKVDDVLKVALLKWSRAAPRLKFRQLQINKQNADIRIEIVRSSSANSRLPTSACEPSPGTVYQTLERINDIVNEFELYIDESADAYDSANAAAVCVATHAFGHALGLLYSHDSKAIMYSLVRCSGRDSVELDQDDIDGIKDLYPDNGGARTVDKGYKYRYNYETESEDSEEEKFGKKVWLRNSEKKKN